MISDWYVNDLFVIAHAHAVPQIYLVELVSESVIRFREIASGQLFGMPPEFLEAILTNAVVHLRFSENYQCDVIAHDPTTITALKLGWPPQDGITPDEWLHDQIVKLRDLRAPV